MRNVRSLGEFQMLCDAGPLSLTGVASISYLFSHNRTRAGLDDLYYRCFGSHLRGWAMATLSLAAFGLLVIGLSLL